MKKKVKKGVKVVKDNKILFTVFMSLVIGIVLFYLWDDIVNTIELLYNGFKKNWKSILLGLISYKVILVNLSKRYAINKGMERFKKSLIYSELDELIHIWISIYSEDIKTKIKKSQELPYIGWIIHLIVNFISWILLLIGSFYALVKMGLGKILLTKVLSAQFWTAILVWLSNIPLFFTFIGVWFWILLENHLPFIPKIYFWFYIKFRTLVNPIWYKIEPLLDIFWGYIIKLEYIILNPIGDFIDKLEIKLICRIKEYIYYKKGENKFKKYMRLVTIHNYGQLNSKEEKDKERRIKQFSLIKKRAKALKNLKYSKKES